MNRPDSGIEASSNFCASKARSTRKLYAPDGDAGYAVATVELPTRLICIPAE